MYGPIFVINPNRSEAVTQGIDRAVERFRIPGGPRIECLTLLDGPDAVQTQKDMATLALPLLALAKKHDKDASAFVIACFSDPSLSLLREQCETPVLGIGECAVLEALTCGERFGVIAMSQATRSRHLRSYGSMGVVARFAGECALELGMAQLRDRKTTLARLIDTGRELTTRHSADVLIMGCAGLADYRVELQDMLGVPVIDPCQAAVGHALGRACLNQGTL
jgi:Asp/Glu/hydantoin racemase